MTNVAIESIADLQTFALVVDSGGFSAAARTLRMTTNAVSRRVIRLERQLDTRLLVRTTRKVATTKEGELFYRRCLRVLEEVASAEAEAGASSREARGLVRFALPSWLLMMPSLLAEIGSTLESHPDLNVQILNSCAPVDLVGARLDFALLPGPLPPSAFVARKLGTFVYALAASTDYVQQRGLPTTLESLARHRCLRFLGDRRRDVWTLVNQSGRKVVVPIGGSFECDDSRTLSDAIFAGLGIGPYLLSECQVAMSPGSLIRILPEYTFAEACDLFALFASPGRTQIPRVRVVVEALRRAILQAQGVPITPATIPRSDEPGDRATGRSG